jgi:transposase
MHLCLSQPLSAGRTKIENPKPRRADARRQRKFHYRIGCIRKDAIHKATTGVASAFETIVIEDLNVSGMSKNHALAGSVLEGRATPESAQMPTCGDMEALAVEQSATKLPWMNRKLDRRTHVRTN